MISISPQPLFSATQGLRSPSHSTGVSSSPAIPSSHSEAWTQCRGQCLDIDRDNSYLGSRDSTHTNICAAFYIFQPTKGAQ